MVAKEGIIASIAKEDVGAFKAPRKVVAAAPKDGVVEGGPGQYVVSVGAQAVEVSAIAPGERSRFLDYWNGGGTGAGAGGDIWGDGDRGVGL